MKKLLCIMALSFSASTYAANDSMLQLLEVLKNKGTIDQSSYDELKSAAKADEEINNAAGADVGKKVEQSLAQLGTPGLTPGKFEIKDKPGDFGWRVIGRIHYDAAMFNGDGKYDQADNSQVRRMRLGVAGTLNTNWKFKGEYDFKELDNGIAGLKDAYIEYVGKLPGLDPVAHPSSIKIVQSHEPFSMELVNSSNNGMFLERAVPVNTIANFVGERNPGIKFSTWTNNFTYTVGVFATRQQETVSAVTVDCFVPNGPAGTKFTCTGTGGQEDTSPRDFNDGHAVTGRITWAPWHDGGHVLHLGAAASYREFLDRNPVRLRERWEVNETNIRLIDTGNFAADNFMRGGAEVAVIEGPFTLQGEYLAMRVNARTINPFFQGYYIQAGYFLTGESRPYNFKDGIWDNVKPLGLVGKGGWGAWELVSRFSEMDLNDETITGGRERNVTVGVNWWPVQNVRFQTNFVKVLDVEGGKYAGTEPSAVTLRAAVFW